MFKKRTCRYGKTEKILFNICVPWNDSKIIENDSVDMIFSQAVLEHVKDLKHTYDAMYKWVKKRWMYFKPN